MNSAYTEHFFNTFYTTLGGRLMPPYSLNVNAAINFIFTTGLKTTKVLTFYSEYVQDPNVQSAQQIAPSPKKEDRKQS